VICGRDFTRSMEPAKAAYIPDDSQTHHRSTSQSRAMLPWFNWGKNFSSLCPLRDSHEDIV
jgi:hypothetical protein